MSSQISSLINGEKCKNDPNIESYSQFANNIKYSSSQIDDEDNSLTLKSQIEQNNSNCLNLIPETQQFQSDSENCTLKGRYLSNDFANKSSDLYTHQHLIPESQRFPNVSRISQCSPLEPHFYGDKITYSNESEGKHDVANMPNTSNCSGSHQHKSPIASRSRSIIRNLTSSGLKRKMKKYQHCKFCSEYVNRKNLERHLKANSHCEALYMGLFKVNSLNAVLVSCFPCLNCSKTGDFSLKVHLNHNKQCFSYYKEKFKVENQKELSQKIKNLKRQSYNSRQPANRKLFENSIKYESVTVTEAINKYRRSIALANYRLCCICFGHYVESSTFEIKPDNQLFTDLNLEENAQVKRMNKFYMCQNCQISKVEKKEILLKPKLNSLEINNKTVFFPNDGDELTEPENIEIENENLVLIPKDIYQLSKVDKHPINIYKCKLLTNETISTMYNNQLYKYYRKKVFTEMFEGTIASEDEKLVTNMKPIIDYRDIRASQAWENSKEQGIKSRFQQFGQAAVAISYKVPIINPETVATALLIQGEVVTLQFEGNNNFDLKTRYFLHNHKVEIDCNATCDKRELLDENIESISFLRSRFLPVYVSTLSQRMKAIVTCLIKNKNCQLYADEYYVGVNFSNEEAATIHALLWTKTCDEFNEDISKSSVTNEYNTNTSYLEYIQSTIKTTSNINVLKSELNITETEADILSKKIKKYQVGKINNLLENLQLPSLECILTKKPPQKATSNMYQSKQFIKTFQNILNLNSTQEKKELTTLKWLENLREQSNITITERTIEFQINDLDIEFIKEERLTTFIDKFGDFEGLYHYALSCKEQENEVIYKRIHLIESFTLPYNIDLLRAVNQTVEVKSVFSYAQWQLSQETSDTDSVNIDSSEISNLLETHKLVSIAELVSLSDTAAIRDIQSSTIEYVSTFINQKQKFRKSNEKDAETYQDQEKKQSYKHLSSNIVRHKNRLNATDMILAEFAIYYEPLNKKGKTLN